MRSAHQVKLRVAALVLVGLTACRFGFDEIASDGPAVIRGSRVQSASSETDFSTTSSTFVDVPGATLAFTPDAPNQAWILLVSAGLSSLSAAEIAAEVRYTVDGVERGYGGTQSLAPDDVGVAMMFDVFTDGAPHTIQLQLRDATNAGARVTDYRLVAVSLPTDAEVWFADAPGARDVTLATFTTHLTLDVTPSAPGDYLILAGATASESPSNSNIGIRMRDPGGLQWPQDFDYYNHRQDWYAFLWARTVSLSAPGTFALDVRANAAATVRLSRIVAIRADAFEAVESSEVLASQATMSTTPVAITTLATQAPPAERDYVVLQHIGLEVNASTFDHGAVFRRDGVDRGSYQFSTESPGNAAGTVDTVRTASVMTLDNACYVTDASFYAQCYESVIHALRLKPY